MLPIYSLCSSVSRQGVFTFHLKCSTMESYEDSYCDKVEEGGDLLA